MHRFYHADHQGSIVALADDYGNALAINGYDAWGIPNAANAGRLGYTGQAWIAELGMYYYKARIYSPMLGRFLQTDPIGYEGGNNLYAYGGNDPINRIDPSGLLDLYVGGGFDDWGPEVVEDYAAQHKGSYRSWTELPGIISDIRGASKRGEPIRIYAHSYGGAVAINASVKAGVKIDLLVTVDPVGPITSRFNRDNLRRWINIRAEPKSWNNSDRIAWLGRKVSRTITDQADLSLTSSAHHGQFPTMLEEALEIDNERKNRAPRKSSALVPFACGIVTKCYGGGGLDVWQ